ncbi:MAG: phosphatidylserine decarboxylase [Gammaproteobacteria bacterium]|nr:phosphatidylserine decarboxylase [Gammaproteobacteria bacterium]
MQENTLNHIKTLPFYLLPKHILSALMYRFMRIKNPTFKDKQIELFIKAFDVNMYEAILDREDFMDFNQFFTRALNPACRDLSVRENQLTSPVDGELSEFGTINDEKLIQAKGQKYTLTELLAGDPELTRTFKSGSFCTIYLSPRDYHRIHMPIAGNLEQMIHVPGDLFSVNQASVQTIPRLFARNERVINIFSTEVGKMALIEVGAIFVSSIENVWHGEVTPPSKRFIQKWTYDKGNVSLSQCEEMGRFNMGSTVILLFEQDKINFSNQLQVGNRIELGNLLADYH